MCVGSLWKDYYGRFTLVLPNGYEISDAEGIAKWADAKISKTIQEGDSIIVYI